MNLKRIGLLLVTVITISFLMMGTNFAAEKEYVDPDIPDSWYNAPQTASEIGIAEFNQSPMLDSKVENGELPPVKERLPDDPPVLEPLNQIGQYGGTALIWGHALQESWTNLWQLTMLGAAGAYPTPEGKEVVPFYLKDWNMSSDYKKITLHLRKGVKWSDGTPFTADDLMYNWKYEANNEDINPVSPENWSPPQINREKEDKYTVTFHFGKTVPRYPEMNMRGDIPGATPAHFMKQFHPEFVDKEKIDKRVAEVELNRWDEYYGRIQDDSPMHPEYKFQRPVLSPYICVERKETYLLLERNPYYPFVDPEGNQLPYIDKIRFNLANSEKMATTKVITGDGTLAVNYTKTSDIPVYKKNEEKEDYRVTTFLKPYGSEVAIMPNLTHKNPKLRAIFQDFRFRKAISYAIDRENINEKVYYGQATPMQATVPPVNQFFKEEYAEAYAEYNPEKAKQILDDMGMIDRNNDGFRERPEGVLETMSGEKIELEGKAFNPTLLFCKSGAIDPTKVLELVRSNLNEIGINIDLKKVSRSLFQERSGSNNADIVCWNIDCQLDLMFGNRYHITKSFAPGEASNYCSPWPGWSNWNATDGEEGVEPPAQIKELINAIDKLVYSPDEAEREAAGEKMVKAQANNLWTIGTVAMAPYPAIFSNDLKNVPDTGIWDWPLRYLGLFHPRQFYLEK